MSTPSAVPAASSQVQSTLAVKVTCDKGNPPSRDPTVSLLATNEATTPIPIRVWPIFTIVDLTLKDAAGNTVQKGSLISGTYSLMPDYIVKPGRSLQLSDWIINMDKPRTTHFPLSYFGYHDLAAGTYVVTASAMMEAFKGTPSQCTLIESPVIAKSVSSAGP